MGYFLAMISPQSVFNFSGDKVKVLDSGWAFETHLKPGAPYFDGHFPENPILPALAFLDLAQLVLAVAKSEDCVPIQKLKNAKFFSPVGPDENLKVLLSQDSQIRWRAVFHAKEKACELVFEV